MLKLISPIYAQTEKWENIAGGKCVNNGVATIQGLECIFYNIVQIIAVIAGLVFLFMFISGGYTYLFSGGEEKKMALASSTLGNAIIGLIGVIVSWLILSFISNFTGVNVIDFVIPG